MNGAFFHADAIMASEISKHVWKTKYAQPGEVHVADSIERVIKSIGVNIDNRLVDDCFRAFLNFELVPGGRILAGAGSSGLTLVNTFVIDEITASPERIIFSLQNSVDSMRMGGGIGCNLSKVAPKGHLYQGKRSPGILAVMELWDKFCEAIVSSRLRRGAMMMVLDARHPEIIDFIESKTRSGFLTHLNASVLVPDDLISAAESGGDWELVFDGVVVRTVAAKELWEKIISTARDFSEPGVIFIDKINRENNLSYCEDIVATNSCAEQPLPKNGSVPLASINLAALVRHPFSDAADLDLPRLRRLSLLGVNFLEAVVDTTEYPRHEQAVEAKATRRVGLGIMGLGDALAMCGHPYGSTSAVDTTARWMASIRDAAYRASINLAREKSPFCRFDPRKFLESGFCRRLPADLRDDIARFGIRNSHLLSVAPTGTISLLANNVSSGIEPIFAHRLQRRVIASGKLRLFNLESLSYRVGSALQNVDVDSQAFMRTAMDLSPDCHINIQSTVQNYVDASISKTINTSADASQEDYHHIFNYSFRSSCKSISTYRPSDTRGFVIQPLG